MSGKLKAFFDKLVEVLFFIGMGVYLFYFAEAFMTAFIEGP